MDIHNYEFIGVTNNLRTQGPPTDAVTAWLALKKVDQSSYYQFRKYSDGALPPNGFSFLSIGYGLSIAYRIIS